jgi:predicted nucleic acid-binding protein
MMSVAVSDTSPLCYLTLIGHIGVLSRLFDTVFIPPTIHSELQHPEAPSEVRRWAASPPDWLRVRMPRRTYDGLDLHAGEIQAIGLALEMPGAALIVDDRKARSAARKAGLPILGTLAVLRAAADEGWLDLGDSLTRLKRTNFHLTDTLIRHLMSGY